MSIVLSSITLDSLIKQGDLSIIRKPQKEGGFNYFITPNVGIKLLHPKIVESNVNYIVLQFEKKTAITLIMLLKSVHNQLIKYIESSYMLSATTKYEVFQEQQDTFTIRCYMPHFKNKYHIETYLRGEKIQFNIPRKNVVLESVYVDVRNIWEKNNKMGYNLEVKVIVY